MNIRLGVCLLLAFGRALFAQEAGPPSSVLKNIKQVVTIPNGTPSLSNVSARFRAVINYVSPPTRRLYVQDGDYAVQVNLIAPVTTFRPGQLVEVQGEV